MMFTGILAAMLLITSGTIAAPISIPPINSSTEIIEIVGALEANSESAIKIIADTLGPEAPVAAVEASAETVSNTVMKAVSTHIRPFSFSLFISKLRLHGKLL